MNFFRAVPVLVAWVALGAFGCAESTPSPVERPTTSGPADSAGGSGPTSFDTQHWGTAHSKRFALTIPLPEPKNWTLDDHSQRELTVRHLATRSVVQIFTTTEPSLVNRQRCEDRARDLGFVPTGKMTTVEDATTIGPGAYDTRVWVTLLPGATERDPILGHVFAFGGYIRKCLFFHFQTEIPSARDESALSARLALARTRILGALALDDFDNLPREEPSKRRGAR
ncbi:hypothetical protein [Pendulispora albinea]|uniref:Uncharacterized protein n=1 Tax=Pendulispora albinea TaxID=2741071 RepID=A0ABZ2LRY9_9BACT